MKNSKIYVLVTCVNLLLSNSLLAQKLFTKSGKILFSSTTALENINAVNKNITVLVDTSTKDIQIGVLIKGFEFEKALMQEHFNENYLESDKYPKATFSGKLQSNEMIAYDKDGIYNTTATGIMMIHGVKKELKINGKLIVSHGVSRLESTFNINLSDYNIVIPSLVADKVSKTVVVNFAAVLDRSL